MGFEGQNIVKNPNGFGFGNTLFFDKNPTFVESLRHSATYESLVILSLFSRLCLESKYKKLLWTTSSQGNKLLKCLL